MDILCYIIQCTHPPLSEPLLNSVFPVVVNTILASDDNSVLQVQLAMGDWCRAGVIKGLVMLGPAWCGGIQVY